MLIIPTVATSAQTLSATLAGQSCRIAIYQKLPGVFLDLYVNDVLVLAGVICLDRVRMVRDSYLGFVGDLCWFDMEGVADPDASGFNGRWLLVYLETTDLP